GCGRLVACRVVSAFLRVAHGCVRYGRVYAPVHSLRGGLSAERTVRVEVLAVVAPCGRRLRLPQPCLRLPAGERLRHLNQRSGPCWNKWATGCVIEDTDRYRYPPVGQCEPRTESRRVKIGRAHV